MNRIGVVTQVLTSVATTLASGELMIVDSKGVIVTPGTAGPYAPDVSLQVFVGTPGGIREVGVIYPNAFTFSPVMYVARTQQVIKMGYVSGSGSITSIDVTAAANVGKFTTVSVVKHDLTKTTSPAWGNVFARDVYIAVGESVATYRAKLLAALTAIVADVNAAFGASTIVLTNSGTTWSDTCFIFTLALGVEFTVHVDGAWTGTVQNTTLGIRYSGLTGPELLEIEKEAAVLDGYNPVQTDKYKMFDMADYSVVASGTNYDGITIHTVSAKQYESPGHPAGWDVTMDLFSPTGSSAYGEHSAEIIALLTEVKAKSAGVYDMITKTAADLAYAAHA